MFLGTATDISQLEVECDLAENLATAPDPGLAISILRSGQASDLATESEAFTARRAALGTDISELECVRPDCYKPERWRIFRPEAAE